MGCPCPCCGQLGACCQPGTCTPETCADCEAAGGKWQGAGTICDGGCPCDPPADHNACEKCLDGVVVDKCGEGQSCCDGRCQDQPCPECTDDGDCPSGQYCCDGECRDGVCCDTNADCESGDWCCDGSCTNNPGCQYVTVVADCEQDPPPATCCTIIRFFPNTAEGLTDAQDWANTNPCPDAVVYYINSNQSGWCCNGQCYPDPGSLPVSAVFGACP